MQTYRDLQVWGKSIDLVELTYRITQKLPDSEKFNLTSQMRRSAVSISSNIAEGHDRRANKEFIRFLHIALGSSSELETQIEIAYRLQFFEKTDYDKLTSLILEVRKMISTLITKIKTD